MSVTKERYLDAGIGRTGLKITRCPAHATVADAYDPNDFHCDACAGSTSRLSRINITFFDRQSRLVWESFIATQ